MPSKPASLVCLPSYNESGNLADLIADIRSALPTAHILVVDDGSTDDTRVIAEQAAKDNPVTVAAHPRNMGLAQAIRTAFDNALALAADDGRIITMDADGTHRPEQMREMIAVADRGADIVVAGRYLSGSEVKGVTPFRKFLSAGARFLTTLVFGELGARDVSCGYRLYSADILRRAREVYGANLIRSQGFSVNVELLIKMARIGARIQQIPLNLRYDLKKGASKIRIARTIRQYLTLYARLILEGKPRLPNSGRFEP